MNNVVDTGASNDSWKGLFIVGGVAALVAGVVFRRNLGPEVYLITGQAPPVSAIDWFTLLQDNRLPGLTLLNLFDVVDYALAGLMFLALCVALWRYNKSYSLIATVLGFVGIAVFFASNTALSMLTLSDQYAAATTDAQRSIFLAAGQADAGLRQSRRHCPGHWSLHELPPRGCCQPDLLDRHAAERRIWQSCRLRRNPGQHV